MELTSNDVKSDLKIIILNHCSKSVKHTVSKVAFITKAIWTLPDLVLLVTYLWHFKVSCGPQGNFLFYLRKPKFYQNLFDLCINSYYFVSDVQHYSRKQGCKIYIYNLDTNHSKRESPHRSQDFNFFLNNFDISHFLEFLLATKCGL